MNDAAAETAVSVVENGGLSRGNVTKGVIKFNAHGAAINVIIERIDGGEVRR